MLSPKSEESNLNSTQFLAENLQTNMNEHVILNILNQPTDFLNAENKPYGTIFRRIFLQCSIYKPVWVTFNLHSYTFSQSINHSYCILKTSYSVVRLPVSFRCGSTCTEGSRDRSPSDIEHFYNYRLHVVDDGLTSLTAAIIGVFKRERILYNYISICVICLRTRLMGYHRPAI